MENMLKKLEEYSPKEVKYKTQKTNTLLNAREFYKGRKMIITAFQNGTFPLPTQYPSDTDNCKPDEMDSQEFQPSKKERPEKERPKYTVSEINKLTIGEKKNITDELFQKHFKQEKPVDMLKDVCKTKNTDENGELVNLINSGLIGLMDETEKVSELEIKIEKPFEIEDIVEKILDFNEHNQKGQGLKILTPNQMFRRLAVSFAQLEAGNNSQKFKNEIRQLL